MTPTGPSKRTKISAAVGYALCSTVITIVNRIVLYTWGFPSASVLALSQLVCATCALWALRAANVVSFATPTLREAFPLPLLHLGNAVTGLAGTGRLSIPTFTALRRGNVVMTMALEYALLDYRYSRSTLASAALVVAGGVTVAAFDLHFDLAGYAIVLGNDVATSLSGVVAKRKAFVGALGLTFVDSLVAAPMLAVYIMIVDPEAVRLSTAFPHWSDVRFCAVFTLSSLLGAVLQLATLHCTRVNSALTTVVVGILKNVVVAYVGMLPSLGYAFDVANFLGVNVSMVGGCLYAYSQL